VEVPDWPGDWTFCGLSVDSPMGVAAGPLLNGKWCLYYASLGFDVLTYKTVRSGPRECYPSPNLVPVTSLPIDGTQARSTPTDTMDGSWAVSFGMPSADPEIWRRDIESTRRALPTGKLLCVSAVGTVHDGWQMEELANDYAECAKWAVESGADVVETNFSCPNVSTCDGQLYQDPVHSELVARTVRAAIGNVPLIIKIGHAIDTGLIRSLIESVGSYADALAMTNSIATTVGQSDDELWFEGQQRGICGAAIHRASVEQVETFTRVQATMDQHLKWIGVGGIASHRDLDDFLQAGAESCQLATAVMVDPQVGLRIRQAQSNP